MVRGCLIEVLRVEVLREHLMPGLGQRLRHRGRFGGDFTEVHRRARQCGLGVEPRQGEQVFRDRAQPLDLAHRLFQCRAAFAGRRAAAAA